MMSFDLPQIPVQETGIVVLAQAAVTIKRLENEPGPFNPFNRLESGQCAGVGGGWAVVE
jgi:hypothetical protein